MAWFNLTAQTQCFLMVISTIYLKINFQYKLHNFHYLCYFKIILKFAYMTKTKFVLECPVGYYRLNCSEKCIYPTYGVDCQSQCECSRDKCNVVTGCFQGEKETTENRRLRMHYLYMRFLPLQYSIILVHISLEDVNINTGLFQLWKNCLI